MSDKDETVYLVHHGHPGETIKIIGAPGCVAAVAAYVERGKEADRLRAEVDRLRGHLSRTMLARLVDGDDWETSPVPPGQPDPLLGGSTDTRGEPKT